MNRTTAPIFVLGCHRSGTSLVAGLLVEAAGVSMGELMPATPDNPLGYYEAIGVVDAHRDLLRQMDRDWTCPPDGFDPATMDLGALREQVAVHRQLPQPWAVKDPRSMFLLGAWAHLGVQHVRALAVLRPVADTIRSIQRRDGIREDRAEAIVAAYLSRLVSIAEQVPLPVVEFPGDGVSIVEQVRAVATASGLPWDRDAASALYTEDLVRNRSPLQDPSRLHDRLLELADGVTEMTTLDLGALTLDSQSPWPLDTHIGPRHAQQRNGLWSMADFTGFRQPVVVELLRDGARPGGPSRPRVTLTQQAVEHPLTAGSTVLDSGRRPHGVVAHHLLDDLDEDEIAHLLRSLYVATHPLAELLLDVPEPHDDVAATTRPPVPAGPRPDAVLRIAGDTGWDHVRSRPVSATRTGIALRKHVRTDEELVPVVTALLGSLAQFDDLDERLRDVERRPVAADASTSASGDADGEPTSDTRELEGQLADERRTSARLRRQLDRTLGRRSVRLALGLAQFARPLFRAVRSWRR